MSLSTITAVIMDSWRTFNDAIDDLLLRTWCPHVVLSSLCIEWSYWRELYEILLIITSAIMDLRIGPPGMHLTTCCSKPDVKEWECYLVFLCRESSGISNRRFYWFLTPNCIKQVVTIALEFPLNFHIQGTCSSALPLMLS